MTKKNNPNRILQSAKVRLTKPTMDVGDKLAVALLKSLIDPLFYAPRPHVKRYIIRNGPTHV